MPKKDTQKSVLRRKRVNFIFLPSPYFILYCDVWTFGSFFENAVSTIYKDSFNITYSKTFNLTSLDVLLI
jgi:hypothetical protein